MPTGSVTRSTSPGASAGLPAAATPQDALRRAVPTAPTVAAPLAEGARVSAIPARTATSPTPSTRVAIAPRTSGGAGGPAAAPIRFSTTCSVGSGIGPGSATPCAAPTATSPPPVLAAGAASSLPCQAAVTRAGTVSPVRIATPIGSTTATALRYLGRGATPSSTSSATCKGLCWACTPSG